MTQPTTFVLEHEPGKDLPEDLITFLSVNNARSIEIDLSGMKALSGRHIELLLSASQHWQSAGLSLVLAHADKTLIERLSAFGMPAHLFSEGK
jgi:anti-anti-sigma regulatory factor